jgi:hypothetical protein
MCAASNTEPEILLQENLKITIIMKYCTSSICNTQIKRIYLWIYSGNFKQNKFAMRSLCPLQGKQELWNPRKPNPVGYLFQVLIKCPAHRLIGSIKAEKIQNTSKMAS